jgi:SPP1 gp7 family putative phage head morphogenesis protein
MLLSDKKRLAQGNAPAPITPPRKGKKNPTLKEQLAPAISRVRADADIGQWRQAEEAALSPLRPRRDRLMAIYYQVTKDLYLTGQMTTLKNKVLSEGFAVVDDKGKENDDVLKLLQRPWFLDFLNRVLDTDFYGHTLIQFPFPDTEGDHVGEFSNISIIPRGQVIPELGQVLLSQYDSVGVPFRDPAYDYTDLLLEVALLDEEGRYSLGILNKAAPEIFWKRHSRIDWSRRSEKFGMPLISLKTDAVEDGVLADKRNALSNMGSNGWMILDENETLEIKEATANQDGRMYKGLVDTVNDEIAYLITGQVATSQETGSRSGGEVHERIQEHYVQARMRFLNMYINYTLWPFLKKWGYPMAGLEFKWRKWIDEENAKLNPPPAPGTDPTADPESDTPPPPNARKKAGKGKPVRLATPNFPKPTAQASAVGYTTEVIELSDPADTRLLKLFNNVVAKLHAEKPKVRAMLKTPEWQAMYQEVASQLLDGAEEGMGQTLPEVKYGTPDAVLLGKFSQHLYVFSANKNYQLLTELNALLIKDGQVRPYPEYKAEALKLHQDYNVSWLRTEYDTAIGTAQMAAKWLTFQEDKDRYFLRYTTANDDRVRPTHKELDGITLPVDHIFWNTHYPPLGWKCRCNVTRVVRSGKEATSEDKLKNLTGHPPDFGHNAGKTGVIFPDSHVYNDVPAGAKPLLYKMATKDAPQPKKKSDG